jgi:ABC-type multidrug transport system ATPase subunit
VNPFRAADATVRSWTAARGDETLLPRLLATALPPSCGQVSALGLDPEVPTERTGIRRRLGYLPPEVGFHQTETAGEVAS